MTLDQGSHERVAAEESMKAYASDGLPDRVITLALAQYGAEVLGYLHAILPSATEADDAFSELCERLWRGLPDFEWKSSFRTWMYVVARNAALNRMRSRARKQRREVPLSAAPEVAGMMERVRTETAVHLKTETRDRFREIRDALDPDDRTLLILRIDRGLSWNETARVLADEEHVDDAELPRLAARLRKRFERLKAKVVAELRNAEVRATP